ncbi:MAG: hypothetical protein R2939_16255 [Kofleriaceae bacterium]
MRSSRPLDHAEASLVWRALSAHVHGRAGPREVRVVDVALVRGELREVRLRWRRRGGVPSA